MRTENKMERTLTLHLNEDEIRYLRTMMQNAVNPGETRKEMELRSRFFDVTTPPPEAG